MFNNIVAKMFKGMRTAEDLNIKENAAKLLRMSPEALQAFEEAYQKNVLDTDTDTGSLFDHSITQIKAQKPDCSNNRK